jgi:hypothetical protein
MSTKKVIASYVVELTENENGCRWITATQLGQSEVFFALRATGTYSDIFATIRALSNELLTTSETHRQWQS